MEVPRTLMNGAINRPTVLETREKENLGNVLRHTGRSFTSNLPTVDRKLLVRTLRSGT